MVKSLQEMLVERVVGVDLNESQDDALINQGLEDLKSLPDAFKKVFPQGKSTVARSHPYNYTSISFLAQTLDTTENWGYMDIHITFNALGDGTYEMQMIPGSDRLYVNPHSKTALYKKRYTVATKPMRKAKGKPDALVKKVEAWLKSSKQFIEDNKVELEKYVEN